MKKILSMMFVALFFMLVSVTSVYATDSFTMSGCPSKITNNGEFTLKISGNYSGGNIDVKLTTKSGSNVIRINGNSTFTLTPVNNFVEVKYKGTKNNGTAEITAEITNGARSITPNKRTCKVGVTTTTKATTKKTTTTTSSKSNNNNLKSLTIKDQDGTVLKYTPDFKADEYVYTVEADSAVKKVNIQPSVEDSKANVIFEPSNYSSVELEDGTTTTITIIVTAEDGTSKKSYTINVKKSALNSDATLKSLTIAEVKDFKFSSDITSYDIKVANNVKKLTIDAKPNNEKSVISKIEGNENLKNGSQVRIIVTSESETVKVYELNIIKSVSTDTTVATTGSDKDPLVIIILSVTAVILLGAIMGVLRK